MRPGESRDTLYALRAILRGRHWGVSGTTAFIVGAGAVPLLDVEIDLPFGERALSTFFLLPLIVAMAAAYPLVEWFPSFSPQLVRGSGLGRGGRAMAGLGLAAVGAAPTVAASRNLSAAVLCLAVYVVCILCVTVTNDKYWLVVSSLYFLCLPVLLSPEGYSAVTAAIDSEFAVLQVLSFGVAGSILYGWGPGLLRH